MKAICLTGNIVLCLIGKYSSELSSIQAARMVMWDLLQGMAAQWVLERAVWKSASMRPGEQCQMMDGLPMMLVWYADS